MLNYDTIKIHNNNQLNMIQPLIQTQPCLCVFIHIDSYEHT